MKTPTLIGIGTLLIALLVATISVDAQGIVHPNRPNSAVVLERLGTLSIQIDNYSIDDTTITIDSTAILAPEQFSEVVPPNNQSALVIQPVPEPTTFALALFSVSVLVTLLHVKAYLRRSSPDSQ